MKKAPLGGAVVVGYEEAVLWLRNLTWSRAAWMVFQAGFTALGVWTGISTQPAPTWRPAFIVIETAIGFGLGLAFTVVWVFIYELMRYTLPRLTRRAAQKVRGCHPV